MENNFIVESDIAGENQRNERCGKMQNAFTESGISIIKTTFDSNKQNGLLPRDVYYGIECGKLWELDEESASLSVQICAEKLLKMLSPLLEKKDSISVLVVGIGNRTATPDALGPMTADNINPQRSDCGAFADVSVLIPGVISNTGIDTAIHVSSVSKSLGVNVIIAVDGLATNDFSRLGSYIQIGNCGITPGSGANKRGSELSYVATGIPVISIGIPTVLGTRMISRDSKESFHVSVTPKECDAVCAIGASILSKAINQALENLSLIE